jgi:hypothetical protein
VRVATTLPLENVKKMNKLIELFLKQLHVTCFKQHDIYLFIFRYVFVERVLCKIKSATKKDAFAYRLCRGYDEEEEAH